VGRGVSRPKVFICFNIIVSVSFSTAKLLIYRPIDSLTLQGPRCGSRLTLGQTHYFTLSTFDRLASRVVYKARNVIGCMTFNVLRNIDSLCLLKIDKNSAKRSESLTAIYFSCAVTIKKYVKWVEISINILL